VTELAALRVGLFAGTLEPETTIDDLRRLADDLGTTGLDWWRLGRPDPLAEFRDLEISYTLHLDPDCEVRLDVAAWRADVRALATEVLVGLEALGATTR
jgi:hypothetical protein